MPMDSPISMSSNPLAQSESNNNSVGLTSYELDPELQLGTDRIISAPPEGLSAPSLFNTLRLREIGCPLDAKQEAIRLLLELTNHGSDRDPELQSFDSTLRHGANRIISALAVGLDAPSLFDTLAEISCPLDANQEAARLVLEDKKDIWGHAELLGPVEHYFDSSHRVLAFCTALGKRLKQAHNSQHLILALLERFKQEEEEDTKYKMVLDKLKDFKAAGDPFTGEFFRAFEAVYRQQVSMLNKLDKMKNKLDNKMKRMRRWRKVSTVIFVSAFAAVLGCSVVVTAVTVPHVIPALATAGATAMGLLGKWLNSLWNDYLKALKGQQEVIGKMWLHTRVAILDLVTIRLLVDRMKVQIGSLVGIVEVALGQEEELKFVMEEIEKKLGAFMNGVEDLGKQADTCARKIPMASTDVLRRIIDHPNY